MSTPRTTDDTRHYRRILNDLIELGADLARGVHDRAMAKPAQMPAAEAALAFECTASAIRRAILVAQKLDQILPRSRSGTHQAFARSRILSEVEVAIGHATQGKSVAVLRAELAGRMDGPDLEYDVTSRPLPEIVAGIVRDLGLHDHAGSQQHRTPDDIARLLALVTADPDASARPPAPGTVVLRFPPPVRNP